METHHLASSLLGTGFEMKTVEGVSLASNIKANKAKKKGNLLP